MLWASLACVAILTKICAGLVFAEIGRHTGLFNTEVYTTVVIVIAYTTLFTPFWLRLFYRYYGHLIEETKTG